MLVRVTSYRYILGCVLCSMLVIVMDTTSATAQSKYGGESDLYGPSSSVVGGLLEGREARIPATITQDEDAPIINGLSNLDFAPESEVVLAQAQAPGTPPTGATPTAAAESTFGGLGFGWLSNSFVSGFQTYLEVGSATNDTPNAAFIEARTDAASTLQDLPSVTIEKRSPIVSDPVLQGRRLGQVPARGSYWFPARQDLDTMLSKIDSNLVREIITIRGPYSVQYGPGLAFYDLRLFDAPRYEHGFEGHGTTLLDYKTNGEQWHGRQELYGGSADWGYRIGYSHRTGSDYETGDGTELPSSYNSRLPDVALGANLTENSSIDFRYLRLDQTDVEFPGQFFDINYLVTDAYEVTYKVQDQRHFDRLTLDSWYNRTRFEGDSLNPRKQHPSPFGFGNLVSFTDVDAMSTGFRLAMSWGQPGVSELTAGVDLRYLKQELNEYNQLINLPPLPPFFPFNQPPFTGPTNNPIPDSHSSNPGLFVDYDVQVSDRLSVKTGARVDSVSTNAATYVPGTDFFLVDPMVNPVPPFEYREDNLERVLLGEFDQHFNLWAAYVVAEYQLNRHWTMTAGGGHSERPPTMTELYAASPFIAVLPQFELTSVAGDPNLAPERMWQIDLGLTAEYRHVRGSIQGFYSWVQDFITLDILNPGGFGYSYVNTNRATLSGFEWAGECDLTSHLMGFANVSYVEGRDHTRNQTVSTQRATFQPGTPRSGSLVAEEPLPVIAPIQSIAGVRLGPGGARPAWAVEFFARIVDAQDRIATSLRELQTPGFTTYNIRSYWQASDRLLLTAGVDNLTDKFYQEHFDTHRSSFPYLVYQPGINFYFGAQLTY